MCWTKIYLSVQRYNKKCTYARKWAFFLKKIDLSIGNAISLPIVSLLTGGLWNVLQEVQPYFQKKCECLEYGLHSANVATGEYWKIRSSIARYDFSNRQCPKYKKKFIYANLFKKKRTSSSRRGSSDLFVIYIPDYTCFHYQ